MWLLDARSKKLKAVPDERRHKYAILSHTWGEEEVKFQDIQAGGWSRKKGAEKINLTCRQALHHEIDYVWIDTCCIDSTSSAEVTEAMNSMYRWYSKAEICYAYLFDAIPGDIARDPFQRIKACRWFTRGWTLQELLASRAMYFYGPPRGQNSWALIGSKRDLCDVLTTLTRIDRKVLSFETPLESVSIAARMSWAAGRKTTRDEDRAYSLLGIFGVSMPMLYGEGHRAFIRLQEEILKRSADQSILLRNSRDTRFASNDELLAQSPDEFWKLPRVIQWKNDASDVPFRMTVSGVETYIGLVEHEHPSQEGRNFYGVLNCRYQDNLEGPLALLLEEKEVAEPLGGGNANSRRFSLYHPKDKKEVRCFQVVPLDTALKATWQTVTLLKPNVIDFQHPSWGWDALPRVWIRKDELTMGGHDVRWKYPNQAWSESLFDPNIESTWERGLGCIELMERGAATSEAFILAFKLRNPKDACALAVFHTHQVPEYHLDHDLEALRKRVEIIFHRCKGYDHDSEKRRVSDSKISPKRRKSYAGRTLSVVAGMDACRYVKFEAECVNRMGELVWILRVSISDPAEDSGEPSDSSAGFNRRLSISLSRTTSNQDMVYWSSS